MDPRDPAVPELLRRGRIESPAGSSTPRTPRCSAPCAPTASSCAASTSRCAGSGRSGTSRTAPSPAGRSPRSCLRGGGLARRAARRCTATARSGPGMVQIWVDTDDERELVDVCSPEDGAVRLAGGVARPRCAGRAGRAGPRRHARAAADGGVRRGRRTTPTARAGTCSRASTATSTASTTASCLHVEDKLRTVLWGWVGQPLPDDVVEGLEKLRDRARRRRSATCWASTSPAVRCARCSSAGGRACSTTPAFPEPSGYGPAIPWPAF